MILSEAINSCFQTRTAWTSGRGAAAARILCNHVLRILGDLSISDVDTHHFKKITLQMRDEKYSDSYINQAMSMLHTILIELIEEGHKGIPNPPYKKLRINNARLDYYSEDEISLLLSEASKLPDHMLLHDSILFAYKTGCRQREMLGLTSACTDLHNREITFFQTKNGRDHTLPMHSDLTEVIKRRSSLRIDERLFPWEGSKNGADELRKSFKAIRDKLGLSDKKLWHTIRHTTGTHLVSRGAPLRVVMGVFNHTNINSTLRYAKANDHSKREALDML